MNKQPDQHAQTEFNSIYYHSEWYIDKGEYKDMHEVAEMAGDFIEGVSGTAKWRLVEASSNIEILIGALLGEWATEKTWGLPNVVHVILWMCAVLRYVEYYNVGGM